MTQYDFSGDASNVPTSGEEMFGDASSIAAQGNTGLRPLDVTCRPLTHCRAAVTSRSSATPPAPASMP